MNKIEVKVIQEASENPAGIMLSLAKLTQRGHKIKTMNDLLNMFAKTYNDVNTHKASTDFLKNMANLPHGTIKRFSPITIAIVGASRRFLSQARTHQVGLDYVSASLQYSDYSGQADFVVPYELLNKHRYKERQEYLSCCKEAMQHYQVLINNGITNDTAGYATPQGLRNILVMQGNIQSWSYFIGLRTCNRNTVETQYVSLLIWDALLGTTNGKTLFNNCGPWCVHGNCLEGDKACGHVLYDNAVNEYLHNKPYCTLPQAIIATKFPLLHQEEKE